ncbi:MAG: hypothetical protein P8R54_19170 [Myxococcota bacterium]|nr:hypothetical protein [Myxococcota bacterium]
MLSAETGHDRSLPAVGLLDFWRVCGERWQPRDRPGHHRHLDRRCGAIGCQPSVFDAAGWAEVERSIPEPVESTDTASSSSLEATSPGPGLVSVHYAGVPDEFCRGFCQSAAEADAAELVPFAFGSEAGADAVGRT